MAGSGRSTPRRVALPDMPWTALVARRRELAVADQRGLSLVEVILAIMLIGTVILSLAAGMLTLVRTSASTSERQQVQLALGSITENLLVSPYVPCQFAPTDPAAAAAFHDGRYHAWPGSWVPSLPGMSAAKITRVEYWNTDPDGNPSTTDGAYRSACPPDPSGVPATRDQGTQRVTVEVSMNGRPPSTAQVVLSARVTP